MGSPAVLSKSAFVERVTRRAGRYGVAFHGGRLDEWIKQVLALKADTGQRKGSHPTYTYGYRQYRRALQLVRLYGSGKDDRDEILVQLFMCGYSVQPHEIREALLREFRKARSKLIAQVRSTYADRQGAIPSGRKKQFRRQIGQQDERFRVRGLELSDDEVIDFVRIARDPSARETLKTTQQIFPATDDEIRNTLFAAVRYLTSGVLDSDDAQLTELERIIMSSDARTYRLARGTVRDLRWMFRQFAQNEKNDLAMREASGLFVGALSQREVAAFFLPLVLRVLQLGSAQPGH